MISDRDRAIVVTLFSRGAVTAKNNLFGTIDIHPTDEFTNRLLKRLRDRQEVDDLHHAPRCEANHWCRQRLVLRICNCGAARQAQKEKQQAMITEQKAQAIRDEDMVRANQFWEEYMAEVAARKAKNHHTNCGFCNRFVSKEQWEPKTGSTKPTCSECTTDHDLPN